MKLSTQMLIRDGMWGDSMTYIATYRDGKVILKGEVDGWYLAWAYKQAKKEAKNNGWILLSVEPKDYPPIPQIVHSEKPRGERWERPILRAKIA